MGQGASERRGAGVEASAGQVGHRGRWYAGCPRVAQPRSRRDARSLTPDPMLDSGSRDRSPDVPITLERADGPRARAPDRGPGAHRLPRGIDPGRRAGRAPGGRHGPADDRLGTDRRDQCLAGARTALGGGRRGRRPAEGRIARAARPVRDRRSARRGPVRRGCRGRRDLVGLRRVPERTRASGRASGRCWSSSRSPSCSRRRCSSA